MNFIFTEEPINPCTPSPCGANAVCTERNGAGACSCIQDYQGNPYEGCRPECVLSSDCPTDRACVRNKCQDPCPGVCAQFAQCTVVNHIPTCTCPQGYVGNPFVSCAVQQTPGKYIYYKGIIICLYSFYKWVCSIVKIFPTTSTLVWTSQLSFTFLFTMWKYMTFNTSISSPHMIHILTVCKT